MSKNEHVFVHSDAPVLNNYVDSESGIRQTLIIQSPYICSVVSCMCSEHSCNTVYCSVLLSRNYMLIIN